MRSSPYRCACVVVSAPPQGMFVIPLSKLLGIRHLSTFVINSIAGFLAGVIAGLYSRRFLSDPAHVMLATGFLGGFSTFSTMMNESVTLLRGGRITVFVGYVLTSVVVPVMAAALGYCLVV